MLGNEVHECSHPGKDTRGASGRGASPAGIPSSGTTNPPGHHASQRPGATGPQTCKGPSRVTLVGWKGAMFPCASSSKLKVLRDRSAPPQQPAQPCWLLPITGKPQGRREICLLCRFLVALPTPGSLAQFTQVPPVSAGRGHLDAEVELLPSAMHRAGPGETANTRQPPARSPNPTIRRSLLPLSS